MQWLKRRLRHRDDRGVTTVLVAVLLTGFLLGMGAFVTDVGSWYAEKAQLQNGADGAALAVAQTCASGSCDSSTGSSGTAGRYANANANDGATTVDAVCGNGPKLSPCGSNMCPAGKGNYVDVTTETLTSSGSHLMPPIMANLLPGMKFAGKNVVACAQASLGPPGSLGNGTAVTISACEWYKDTANGTQFATVPARNSDATPNYAYHQSVPTGLPSYIDTLTARSTDAAYLDPQTNKNFYAENNISDPHTTKRMYSYGGVLQTARIASSETVITTHGFGNNCNSGAPGSTSPGQFSWLSNSSCTVSITPPTYPGVSGNSSAPCEAVFTYSRNTGTPIYLPVYSNVNSGTYTLLGFAAFIVTGWDVTSGNAGNWSVKKAPSKVALADPGPYKNGASDPTNYCGKYTGSSSDVCIYGFFTQALISAATMPGGGTGGQDLGATSVQLTG